MGKLALIFIVTLIASLNIFANDLKNMRDFHDELNGIDLSFAQREIGRASCRERVYVLG